MKNCIRISLNLFYEQTKMIFAPKNGENQVDSWFGMEGVWLVWNGFFW